LIGSARNEIKRRIKKKKEKEKEMMRSARETGERERWCL